MKKLCIVYNFPQKYRSAIFQLIDREWDCDWYFGNNTTDICGFDIKILKNVKVVKNIKLFGPVTFQYKIVSLLFKKKYDTFLMLGDINCLSTWLIIILKQLFFPSKKIYLWTHGWYGREGRIKKLFKHLFFSKVDGIFLYGNYAKNLMLKEGFDKNKLIVIHNSLDYAYQSNLRAKMKESDIFKIHFGNNYPNIIFIGRLTKVKRIDLLIEAAAKLNSDNFPINITLIGDGTETEFLQQLAKAKGISDRIWFYGSCYDDKINSELIFNADLCVAPGNVGLTAMHTMAFGTPVLTHDNFPMQMPEFEAIVPNRSGAFFTYNNIDSLANCIKTWFFQHNEDREKIRNYCINIVEDSWNPNYQIKIIKENLR